MEKEIKDKKLDQYIDVSLGVTKHICSNMSLFLIKQSENIKFLNNEKSLKAGDTIAFYNGNNVKMKTIIIGFNIKDENKAYLYWDCYWATIDLDTRLIKKL